MIDAFDALKISTSRLNAARMQQQAKAAGTGGVRNVLPSPLFQLRASAPASDSFVKSAAPTAGATLGQAAQPGNSPIQFLRMLKDRMLPPARPAAPIRATNQVLPTQNPTVIQAAALRTPDFRLPLPRRQGDNPFGNVKIPVPQTNASGLSALALPLMSVGMLAAPVAAPATLVAKPAMMNQIIGAVSAWFA